MKKTVFLLASLFVMMLATQQMKAQNGATASAIAAANIITPIQISKADDLYFGNIVAGTTPGTVTVSPGGNRSNEGGVTLPTATPGTITAAKFNISGLPNATYSITLPTSITITKNGGSETMTIENFNSDPNGTGTIATDGTQILAVGATLKVGESQAAGTYQGSFSVTVAYN
jgi:hypothetical protein